MRCSWTEADCFCKVFWLYLCENCGSVYSLHLFGLYLSGDLFSLFIYSSLSLFSFPFKKILSDRNFYPYMVYNLCCLVRKS